MTPIDFEITVSLGGRDRRVSAAELASAIGADLPRLRAALLGLVHGPMVDPKPASLSPVCPQEEGDYRGRSLPKLRKRNGFIESRSVPFGPFGEEGGLGEGTPSAVDNERFADYLADVFRDDKSLAFYKLVAASVPREVVRAALARALDVPRRDVRKSRAAIFTALVRPYLPRPRLPRPPSSP